jgi:hypothetical protein
LVRKDLVYVLPQTIWPQYNKFYKDSKWRFCDQENCLMEFNWKRTDLVLIHTILQQNILIFCKDSKWRFSDTRSIQTWYDIYKIVPYLACSDNNIVFVYFVLAQNLKYIEIKQICSRKGKTLLHVFCILTILGNIVLPPFESIFIFLIIFFIP